MVLMNPPFCPSLSGQVGRVGLGGGFESIWIITAFDVYTCTQVADDYCVRWAVHMLQDTQLERGLSSTTAKQLERF